MVAVLGCKAAFMLHACGVLARRRERGASNVLTTPPTPCMLGGHDGDSNSVKICGTPALLHPDPPPYIASQQENTHATYVSSACRFVPSGTAQRVTPTQAHGSQAQAMLPCSMMPGSMKNDGKRVGSPLCGFTRGGCWEPWGEGWCGRPCVHPQHSHNRWNSTAVAIEFQPCECAECKASREEGEASITPRGQPLNEEPPQTEGPGTEDYAPPPPRGTDLHTQATAAIRRGESPFGGGSRTSGGHTARQELSDPRDGEGGDLRRQPTTGRKGDYHGDPEEARGT